MVNDRTIKRLKRVDIDTTQWDRCLERSSNASPYARIEYLDALCPCWEALVAGNYEYIMPLPVKRKMGIRYLYQPFLVPHLGVYGANLDPVVTEAFLNNIPSEIKWIDLCLNPASLPDSDKFPIQLRTNFILDLSEQYDKIKARYRTNHIRNIQRAQQAGCRIDRHIEPKQIFELAEQFLGPKKLFPAQHKSAFIELADKWIQNGHGCTYGIRIGEQVVASALFLLYKNRAYYLLIGNHPNGKTVGASHALIDAFIQDHAGREVILDFEGSDTPSLAFFYEGFGSQKEYFGWLRIDRLPKLISWLKKLR